MRVMRWAVAFLLWFAGIPVALFAQPTEPKVVVERLDSSDLERTAHRLRISVEQLQQARQVLDEATELLAKAELQDLAKGGQIAAFWGKIHRRQAIDRLEGLIMQRSRQVPGLEDPSGYDVLTKWAIQTASRLASLHPSRALQAVEAWPPPPRHLGERAADLYEQIHSKLAGDGFPSRYDKDPPGTLGRLLNSSSPVGRIYSELIEVRRSQDRQEANRVIDEFVAEMGKMDAQRGTLLQLSNMIQRTGELPHDRTEELSEALVSAYQRYGDSQAEGLSYLFEANGQQVELGPGEYQFLHDLRRFAGQPEMTLRMADSWPGLREKIDLMGGLDRAISARPAHLRRPADSGNPSPQQNADKAMELLQELRYEALEHPGWVRRRLDQTAQQSQDGFNLLMRFAQSSRILQPELAALALERAKAFIDEAQDPVAASSCFMYFARTYRELEGSLTPALIRQGFQLLDDLEQANLRKEEGMSASSRSKRISVSSARAFLVGEWARIDFLGSLAEARAEEDLGERLRLLTSIVGHLIR